MSVHECFINYVSIWSTTQTHRLLYAHNANYMYTIRSIVHVYTCRVTIEQKIELAYIEKRKRNTIKSYERVYRYDHKHSQGVVKEAQT